MPETRFVGYEKLSAEAKILALVSEEELQQTVGEGAEAILVLDETPMYAEMGGQVGDRGEIYSDTGRAEVLDTKKFPGDITAHIVKVCEGEFRVGDAVSAAIDTRRRMSIARNHSATHLLHKALCEVLGTHVAQAGSLVDETHLRFDFSHFSAMTEIELQAVENKVNDAILASLPVIVRELPIEEAKKLGAAAQFGEKYGEIVRVVSMGDYSIEFCGGCHLTNTAEAGLFKILSEAGVAAGTRRIEAVTGYGVLNYINKRNEIMQHTAESLKANPMEIGAKVDALIAEMREVKRELESVKAKIAGGKANDALSGKLTIDGVDVIVTRADGLSVPDLRTMGDSIKEKLDKGVVVIGSHTDGKLMFLAMATKAAVERGVHAGNIIREVTALAGGSGGGKPDMAQGGGKDVSKTDAALAAVEAIVKAQLK